MKITLDCSGIADRKEFHSRIAQALRFPDWYGSNLDALMDCLTELDGIELELDHWQEVQEALGDYGLAARETFRDAAEENPGFSVTFS